MGFSAATPLLAAAAGTLLWIVVILLAAGRGSRRLPVVLASLFGGACAGVAAGNATPVAVGWLARALDADRASALGATVAAPVVEEAVKLAALLALTVVWRARDARDGIVRGALVGAGFAFTENVATFTFAALQGRARLAQSWYLRAIIGGPAHPLFSAIAGAGVPPARRRGPLVLAGTGLVAVGTHVLWNAAAAPVLSDLLCAAAAPGLPCRLAPTLGDLALRAPAIALLGLAPAAGALAVLGRRRGG